MGIFLYTSLAPSRKNIPITFLVYFFFFYYKYIYMGGCLYVLSHVWLFVAPWTIAHQGPLPMEFSRQEYWSGLPFPTPRDLPNPRDLTHISCVSCIGRQVLYHSATGETLMLISHHQNSHHIFLPGEPSGPFIKRHAHKS